MAAKKRAAKAGAGALALKDSPYVQRLVQDAELRENIKEAYESLRKVYGRLSNGKAPAKTLLDDKKVQKELRSAAISLRDAGEALREGPKRRKKRHWGRRLLILGIGAGLALALSEGLRQKVLDLLFGAEEEFDYSSTTTPATPAPTPGATTPA
jgi:hypothetical protein